MRISEIYPGIQGEGIYTGLPTIFVRVAGCNYAVDGHPCTYCDSSFAWKPESGVEYTKDELKSKVDKVSLITGCQNICLTGGEPLMFEEELNDNIYWWSKRYHLSIETNGSWPIKKSTDIKWSQDIKCPSSGNVDYNIYENIKNLDIGDQVKFVIGNSEDYDFAKRIVNGYVVFSYVIFQVAWGQLDPKELIEWVLADRDMVQKSVRVMLQQHKVVFGNLRGV